MSTHDHTHTGADADVHAPYVGETPRERFVIFFLVAMGVISLTYGFFFAIDFLPEKPGTNAALTDDSQGETREGLDALPLATTTPEAPKEEEAQTEVVVSDAYPKRIIFDTLDREVAVLNPESSDIATLDAALLSGVVRHPDSADFKNTGTIFLFGHSSYLPNVRNKNYQAFNGIQHMQWGDTVRLQSSEFEYVYSVDRVYEVSATDAEVKIETGTAKLTLVTCDSFGAKSDRFVVEATLIRTTPLSVGV